MRTLVLLLLLLAGPTRAETAGALYPEPGAPMHGAASAPGAVVWMHGAYHEGDGPAPAATFLQRLARERGWDLWRLDRPSMTNRGDPMDPAAAQLREGTAALRARGYRQVAVVGESRGAFIALLAAAGAPQPLADVLLMVAPAAHGPRPERRPQAMADYRAALDRLAPGVLRRLGLVQFQDDPYDPDPPGRAEALRQAAARLGVPALVLFHPTEPQGHGGLNDPSFDPRFGTCLSQFLDLARPAPATCLDATTVRASESRRR